MTKKEKQIIRNAIENLMDEDGNYHKAISDLCNLVNWRYLPGEEMRDIRHISLEDFLKENPGNVEFKAPTL